MVSVCALIALPSRNEPTTLQSTLCQDPNLTNVSDVVWRSQPVRSVAPVTNNVWKTVLSSADELAGRTLIWLNFRPQLIVNWNLCAVHNWREGCGTFPTRSRAVEPELKFSARALAQAPSLTSKVFGSGFGSNDLVQ